MPRLYAELAALVLAAVLLGGLWSHGYSRGRASQTARIAALERAQADAAFAQQRATAAREAALKASTSRIVEDYQNALVRSANRAAAAESAYARLLRQYARRGAVPEAAKPAPGADGPAEPGSDERDRRFADGLARVAGECERTAAQLGQLQRWAKSLTETY